MLFTAYSIVRTVPSANRPNREGKKSVEALLHLELRRWALAASYAEKKRPYDDVTGHLKVDNALHPSFLPGRVLPTFQKLQKWQNPRVKAGL